MCDFEGITAGNRLSIIPPDFVPYMEKHRLYEFFYELVMQLLIQQPEDPLVFMKQCIQHAIRKRDIPRLVLIAPPNFDKMALAKILQEELGIRPVTLKDLHAISSADHACRCYDANDIAIRMKQLLMSGILHESGWTLVDIPRSKKEARALQRVGVIPTHVIQIVLPGINETGKKTITSDPDYKRILRGLREAYANLLIEVEVGTRTMEELGKDCATLAKIRKHYGAPSLFRIVLIGPRGSGRRSLAKHISERFNLVHIDFNYILDQACLQETALGEILRLCEHRCGRNLKSEAKIQILERNMLESGCLKRGWVLTGYPITAEDFKLLDKISTSPNRVIILEVDIQTCKERLLNRRSCTETEHNLISSESSSSIKDSVCKPAVHLTNHEDTVEQDLREYEENIESIMRYAGETASVIDASCEIKFVREKLEACLMRPAPIAKPRFQAPPAIDPMDIEFDPDDEPDSSVFDDIRAPEPKFSFI